MSNFLALATVTATLRRLLQSAVQGDVSGATVTTVRPDASAEGLPDVGVNLFLYQVTPNVQRRNGDLPTRSPSGRPVNRPVLALDLHYLLTFHGDDAELEPQRVMGSALRTLLANPILTRSMVEQTLEAARGADPDHWLLASDLPAAVESVKFTPLHLSLEELSRLWSVFFETPYTLCMAYQGTAILLEADTPASRPLPVRLRNIGVFPFRQAVLEAAVSDAGEGEPVEEGSTLVLRGTGLSGPVHRVRVGAAELDPLPGSLTPTELRVVLTGPELRAGVLAVGIRYLDGTISTSVPLALRPRVGVVQAEVTPEVVPLTFVPPVGRRQRTRLYLNQLDTPPGGEPRAFQFDAPQDNGLDSSDPDWAATIRFPIQGVPAGRYLVRAEVAGAESFPGVDVLEGSPTFGRYVTPAVDIP